MRGTPIYNPKNPFKEKIDVVGQSGSGKNVLVAYLLSIDPNPYTFFDTLGVMASRGFKPRYPKIQRIVTPPNALKFFFTEKPKKGVADDLQQCFEDVCKQVVAEGNQTFWVDEAPNFSNKWWYESKLKDIANKGQNIDLNLGILHQRPAQIFNDVLANLQHRFIFPLELEGDKEFYAKIIPNGRKIFFDTIKDGKPIPAPFSLMKQYGFLYYNSITKQLKFCDPL